MLNKVLQIARREYLETVKTKAFLIGILVLPVFTIGVILVGGKMQKKAFSGPREAHQLAVINLDQKIDRPLKEVFENYNEENQERKIVPHFLDMSEEEGKAAVHNKDFDALLFVQDFIVSGDGHALLYSGPSSDITLQPTIHRLINDAVTNTRYAENGLSPELVRKLSRGVRLEDVQLSDKGEAKQNRMARMFLPYFFCMLLFFGVITSSQGLLNSVIEEKNSRVIEVMLSAVSPDKMMAGKILGQSSVGLTLVALYCVGGVIAVKLSGFGEVLSNLGASDAIVFIPFFIIAFVLFNSIYAAVGGAFNSLKEAQSFVVPINLTLVIPLIFWNIIAQQPDGTLSVVLSFIPPISPLVMVMRIVVLPSIPWLQVALSLALLIVAVVVVVWAAARVFRVGILMYGKPPSLREIFRWVREA